MFSNEQKYIRVFRKSPKIYSLGEKNSTKKMHMSEND